MGRGGVWSGGLKKNPKEHKDDECEILDFDLERDQRGR